MPNNGVLIANPDTAQDIRRRLNLRNVEIILQSLPRNIIILSRRRLTTKISCDKNVLEHVDKALSEGYDAVIVEISIRAKCRKFLNKLKYMLSVSVSKLLSFFVPDVCSSDEFLLELIAFRHDSFSKLLSCWLAFSGSVITQFDPRVLVSSGLRVCRLNLSIDITDEFYDNLSFRDILSHTIEVLREAGYRPLKFALVGSSGIIVNEGMLYLLHGVVGLPVFLAGFLAIESSIVNNFTLHEAWTFKQKLLSRNFRSKIQRFFKYHLAVGAGVMVNYLTLLLLNKLFGMCYDANLIGIALGFIVNYLISDRFVWRRKRSDK
ncbi:MAG: GtrA family protein [Crenarchaeota archaeon]|nr:GtrA family protein [Thermoproteota archaeon]